MKKLLGFLTFALAASVTFAEDAYLESDGTQYIVTGYHPTEKMKLVVDFQVKEVKAGRSILGNKNTGGSGASFNVWMNNGTPPIFEGSFVSETNSNIWTGRLKNEIDTSRATLEVDYGAGKFALLKPDGQPFDSYSPRTPAETRRTGTGDRPLSFFTSTPALANADTAGAAMKLYSAQVYEDGELIHDYVPCKKGDRIGLYDTKTCEFWGSVTRQLAIAGDYLTIDDDPYVASPENNVTSGATAIFDTLYKPNAKTRVELDYAQAADYTLEKGDWCYMMSNTKAGNDGGLFNVYQSARATLEISMSMGTNSLGVKQDQWVALAKTGAPQTYGKDIRHTVILDNVNGNATLLTSGCLAGSYAVKVPWYADRVHENTLKVGGFAGNSGGYAPMKIYGLKIYETENEVETLVHDFKPAAGGRMIDAVTGRILDSMNKTSPFTSSPDFLEEPYVESAGNQYILLDYKPNAKSVIEVDYANLETTKSRYVFGSDGTAFFWVNSNGNQEYYCHKAWSGGYPAGVDGRRHTTVIDIPGSKIYYKDSIYGVNAVKDMTTRTGYEADVAESSYAMALFNRNASSVSLSAGAICRIYSAKVWEDGELIHEYLPCVKDGLVGFKDSKTGKFFAGKLKNGANPFSYGLTYGGAIATDGSTDAYIESDQTQYIKTDYYPTTATKVEIDYQLTKVVKDLYIFGSNKEPNWELYVNGNYGITTICGTGWATVTTAAEFANLERTKMVLDRARGKWSIYRGTSSWLDWKTYATASTAASTVPFGIFARQESNGTHYPLPTTEVTGGMVPMKLYSFRVWEGDKLTLELLPYKNGEVTGLKDTLTGNIYTSKEGNPFVIGGKGYDGTKTFATALDGDVSVAAGGSATFGPVFAPGAIRYEWTRGGVPLAETGDTVTLGWQRLKGDYAQEISVTPVYNVYGTEVKGEPSTATLTNEPLGMAILIR